MRKPGAAVGGLVGALVTAPLIAVFYLAWKLAELPFVPFNLFDWIARILPGRVLTFGIDSMVKAIRALRVADTSSAAKAAEQTMAVAVFLVAGMVAGALLFAVLRVTQARRTVFPGVVLGLAAGIAAVLATRSLGRAESLPPGVGALWTVAAFAVWGAALGRANRRLTLETPAAAGEKRPRRTVKPGSFVVLVVAK